ncbi:MAG: hypothetical protein NTY19_24585 [Planctomycetota bacterium]|nr:hypothetical protein [Planctomycetota bacterium]
MVQTAHAPRDRSSGNGFGCLFRPTASRIIRGQGLLCCKAKWAVQWAPVANGTPAKDKTWAPEEIDANHASVRDGGGLRRLTVAREADGVWTIIR